MVDTQHFKALIGEAHDAVERARSEARRIQGHHRNLGHAEFALCQSLGQLEEANYFVEQHHNEESK
ncbi:hypothetical protein [Stackebrandtia soli]|uniref:hypothetical protein n=1 Tax=Stackebrandtia soli TaxID=1892856 RepID=UPI0039EA294A